MDILFKNITVITMDETRPVWEKNLCVGVTGKHITYVGPYTPQLDAKRVIDGTDKMLIPGLYNCHTHGPMTLLRGFANDMALQEWLFEHVLPAEQKLTRDMITTGALLAVAEMMASGTVAFTDMYFKIDAIADVAAQTGMKACLSNGIVTQDKEGYSYLKDNCYFETMEVIKNHGASSDGRIKGDAAIHGEYTSFEGAWRQVAEFAKENGLHMHVHVSETKFEHDQCKERYGKTPAQMLASQGVFDVPTTAAHCVWTEPEDWDILAEKGVSAAHNPVSNLKLASGIAPVVPMLQRGVNVTLGTDGMASNNTHDLFEEIKLACTLQKTACKDPTVLPAIEALKMATVNGAKSQGRLNCGVIKEGFEADMVLINGHSPQLVPCPDPVAGVVYAATGRDVAMTMCQGRVLYENGIYHSLDIEKVLADAKAMAAILTQ